MESKLELAVRRLIMQFVKKLLVVVVVRILLSLHPVLIALHTSLVFVVIVVELLVFFVSLINLSTSLVFKK